MKLEALAVEPADGEHFRRVASFGAPSSASWCIRGHADPCPVAVGLWESVANFSGPLEQKQNPSVLAPDLFDNVLGLGLDGLNKRPLETTDQCTD